MNTNYEYPFDSDWSHQELHTVITLWNSVEAAYEKGIPKDSFLKAYQAFKEVVPAKGEEKRLSREFEESSGYSLFLVLKTAKATDGKIIKIGK